MLRFVAVPILFVLLGGWQVLCGTIGIVCEQCTPQSHTTEIHTALIKKKTKFSLYTDREIQIGSGAKSYMRKGFLIYEQIHKYFHLIWGVR
jgi:hypothetical protein